jgi:ferredoxin-NADP reductase
MLKMKLLGRKKCLDYYDEFFKSKIEIAKQAGIELNFERWVSRPTENYSGNRGRVSVHIDQLQISKNTAVYICGGNEAIKSIREHLVMKGVDENDFRTERFY